MSVVVAAEEKPKAVPMGKTLDDLFSVLAVPAGEQKEICTYLADPAIRQFARTMIIRPEQAARMIGYLPREHQRPLNESAAERRRGDIDRNEFARDLFAFNQSPSVRQAFDHDKVHAIRKWQVMEKLDDVIAGRKIGPYKVQKRQRA